MRRFRFLLVTTLLGFGISACAGSDPGPVAPPAQLQAATSEVAIERSRFGPTELVITSGTTVTFENFDPFAHTVTANEETTLAFASGDLQQDEQFSVTFDEPGTYRYFCEIHPTMRATVVVE